MSKVDEILEEYETKTLLNDIKYQRDAYAVDIYKAIQITDKTEAKAALQALVEEAIIEEASHYCDDGHYHDNDRDFAMLPSERLAELKSPNYVPAVISKMFGDTK